MKKPAAVAVVAGILLAAFGSLWPLRAEDELARRDGNRTPVMLGVVEGTGEIRMIRTTPDGAVIMSPASGSPSQAVNQGTAGAQEWPVKTKKGTSSMDVSGSTVGVSGSTVTVQTDPAHPINVNVVAGTINAGVSGSTIIVTGSTVNVVNVVSAPLHVNVVSGSISAGVSGSTVHVKNENGGTLAVSANNLDVRDLSFATDKADVTGSAVQVSNAGGVAAVNVQDGGNVLSVDDAGGSLTVDGTVAATQSGAWTVTANAGTGTQATDPVDRAARALGRAFLRDPTNTFNMGSAAAPVRVDTVGVTTAPVSVDSLPLPAGAATESTLSTINGKLPASVAADRTAAGAPSASRLSDGAAFYKATTPSDVQPISATALPLPAGAATSANQATSNGSLSSIDGKLPATVAADRATAGAPSAARLSDGTAFYKATTPSDTQPISAAALPLPAGAATETTAATIAGDTTSLDAKVPSQGQATMAASLPVAIASDQSALPVTQSGAWAVTANAGTGKFNTTGSTVNVTNQEGTSLAVNDAGGALTVDAVNLDTRDLTFAADKVDASGSTLGANNGVDIGNVTVDNTGGAGAVNVQDGGNSLTVDDGGSSLTVDGTVTANAGTGKFNTTGSTVNVANQEGTSLAVNDNGASLTVDASNLDVRDLSSSQDSISAVQSGAWTVTSHQGTAAAQSGRWPMFLSDGTNERGTDTLPLRVDPTGTTTQPVSGTVTSNAGTGTFNVQATAASPAAARLSDGAAFYKATTPADTQPISAAALPLPSGAATAANQSTANGSLASIDGKLPAALTGSGNLKVSLAESTAVQAVSQSGAWTVTANAGTGKFDTTGSTVSIHGSTIQVRNAFGESLNVGDGSGPLTVDGTVAATQSGSWSAAVNNAAGASAVNVQDGGNSLTVDAADLDVRDLTNASDSVTSHQGGAWTVTANAGTGKFNTTGSTVNIANQEGTSLAVNDNGGSLTVDASNLDVRDLSSAQDTVGSVQSGAWAVSVNNAAGASAVNVQDGGNSLTIDDGGGSITVDGTLTATVSGSTIVVRNGIGSDAVNVQDGGNSITVDAANLDVRDLVFSTDKVDASGSTLGANSGVDIGDVTINNAAGAASVNVQDGGNSLTVDAADLDIRNLSSAQDSVAATQSGAWATSVNNAAGASAVNVQDGGNSLTVDAADFDVRDLSSAQDTVGSVQSGAWTVTANAGTGKFNTTGSTVNVANQEGTSLAVNDNGGSLTVDGAVTANAGSGTFAVDNAAGASVSVDDNAGSLTTDTPQLPASLTGSGNLKVSLAESSAVQAVSQSGTWNVGLSAGSNNVGTVSGSTIVVRNGIGVDAVNVQDGGNSLTVDGTVTGNQGTAAAQSGRWPMFLSDGTSERGTASNPLRTDPTGTTPQPASQSGTWVLGSNSGVDIGDVTVNNGSGAGAVNIQDGGNSVTVDAVDLDVRDLAFGSDSVTAHQGGAWSVSLAGGSASIGNVSGSTIVVRNGTGADAVNIQDGGNSLTVDATNLDVRDFAFATDRVDTSGSTLGANSGVDIGDVTVNNAGGASAVNIQDGGNSLTVDTAGGALSVEGQGYTAPAIGTFTVTTSASAIFIANASAVGREVCNEGGAQIRIGTAATLTTAVGRLLDPGACYVLDSLHRYFRGALSAIAVTGTAKVTTTELTP